MKKIKILLLIIVIPFLAFSQKSKDVIRVGLYESPPFVFHEDSNTYKGLCIDILKYLENNLDVKFSIEVYEKDIPPLLKKVENNELDMIVGSITINTQRLKKIDFTQPYYITNLSIAQINKSASYFKTVLTIFSIGTLRILLVLIITLFVMGIIFWYAERKKNPAFRENILGIFDGFYYTVVVMTTVGFGDKVTITPYGKMVTVVWMLISTWLMSFFVAGLSSTMTVEKMNNVIDNIQDLKVTKVASINGTTSSMFLEENNIRFILYTDTKEALDAITNHELETFVYDTPILKYYMKDTKYSNVILSDKKYEPQYYGFGLTKNFKYESELNSLILKFINSDDWDNELRKYNLNE